MVGSRTLAFVAFVSLLGVACSTPSNSNSEGGPSTDASNTDARNSMPSDALATTDSATAHDAQTMDTAHTPGPCDTAHCDPHATCSSATGSAVCTCAAGYTGNGMVCTPPQDGCVLPGGCPVGEWVNVTPTGIPDGGGCGNFGTQSVQADPARPNEMYAEFNCYGIVHSTDYGQTWSGPINTGLNGATAGDCAGGIAMPVRADGISDTTIYEACIRGSGGGFWRSTNAGVDWTRYPIAPTPDRQDYYAPHVDPYDRNHLLMAGHEMNVLVESTDGGQTWTMVHIETGMNEPGGTAAVFFIDTGNAATTRTTWLSIAQQAANSGTWRTQDSGVHWTQVDANEHPHGISQIYQPDSSGVVYMAGAYSSLGWGVVRSTDYGQTWAHVGVMGGESVVFGTPNHVYAMSSDQPNLEIGPADGSGTWTWPVTTPPAFSTGTAWAAVVHDGTHSIIVTASWQSGLWRYIEP